MTRRPVIGVMGGHVHNPAVQKVAHELGALIAKNDWIVLTGGRNQGVMAAATAGCKSAGGFSVGVHPDGPNSRDVAPDCDLVIFTDIGYARNAVNVLSSNAIVALAGSFGTLSEVAYAKTFGVPIVLLGFDDKDWFGPDVIRVKTPEQAIKELRNIL